MHYAAIHDEAGRIQRTMGASLFDDLNAQIAAATYPAEWSLRYAPDMLLPDRNWWDGAAWATRPVPPAPPALTAGVAVFWTGLPPGADVTVDPLNGAAPITSTADGTGTLEIGLPAGPWRISVNEVFPAVAASWLIEVAP